MLGRTLAIQDARLGVVHFSNVMCMQRSAILKTSTGRPFNDSWLCHCLLGIAMTRLKNPLYELPSSDDVVVPQAALRTADNARSAGARGPAYITAVISLFNPALETDWLTRLRAYANAMAKVVAQFPDDREGHHFLCACSESSSVEIRRAQTGPGQ
jgi:hypothetical protein